MKSNSLSIWEWQLVRLIVVGSLLLFALFIGLEGFTEEAIRLIIQWSAKISVICFCLAFGGSAFHLFIQKSFSFWIFRNRKYFGISFAILHLLHLIALVVLQYAFHPVFEKAVTFALIAGGGAYLFLILMLLTSFQRFSKFLSRTQWKVLHTIGGFWIYGVFFSSYFKRVINLEYWNSVFFILLLFVLVLRVWKLFYKKK